MKPFDTLLTFGTDGKVKESHQSQPEQEEPPQRYQEAQGRSLRIECGRGSKVSP